MATITTETIAKYNNEQVLAALEKEREKELALIEASIKYDTTTRGLVKVLGTLEQQSKVNATVQQAASKELDQAVLVELKAAKATEDFNAKMLRLQEVAAGLSGEQQTLNRFIRETEEALKKGVINAKQYADAMAVIRQRQNQLTPTAEPWYKQYTTGVQAATQATGRHTAAMTNLRAQIIDIGVGLQGGQSPLTILSQQGPQVAEALASASGALAAFAGTAATVASGAAVLALALGPVVAGYLDLRQAALDAEETQRLQTDLFAAQIPILEKVRDAQDKALEVIGLRSKAQSDDAEIEQKWAATQEQTRAVLEAKQAVLQASLHMIDETARSTALANVPEKERDAILSEGNATLLERRQRLADVDQGLRELTGNVQAGIDADKAAAEYKRELKEAEEREREAAKKSAEAKREQAEAQRRLNEQIAAAKAINDQRERDYENLVKTREAFEKLYDATQKAASSEEERIALAARAQEAALKDAATAAKTATTSADQRLAIEAELYIGIRNIHDAEQAAYAKLEAETTKKSEEEAKKRAEAEQRLAEQRIGYAADSAGAVGDLIGTMYEQIAEQAEGGTQAQKDAALKWWKAQQIAGISEAGLNTLLAVSKAAASAPPPANLIPMGVAAVQGAAQVAAIASQPPPKFTDTPIGGYRMSPGDQTVQGAPNDTAILFRHPIDGILAAVAAAGKRQAPTSTPAPTRRPSLGRTLATTPIPTLLTHDVARMTRGGLR